MFGLFFTEQREVTTYAHVAQSNIERFKRFFHLMLNEGIYLAPSAYESGFVSLAHGEKEITKTLEAVERAFSIMSSEKE